MTLGAWRRWGSPPTAAEMATGICDHMRPWWLDLTGWLRTAYDLDGDLAWTDEDSGWVLRYRRNGRALTTLLPNAAGGFSALVVVGPSILGTVLASRLSPSTHDALQLATPYADGRWLWLRVTGPDIVDDIRTILSIKSPPPTRGRRRTPRPKASQEQELVPAG